MFKLPYGDKTGPRGQGPATGRGFGPCNGFFGRSRGGGVGSRERGFGWFAPTTKAQAKEDLSAYRKHLEQELEFVKNEEKDLETNK